MQLSLVGINHQTAPITIREKVAIGGESLIDALSSLHAYVPQGVILSTCNRTEIYTVDDCDGDDAEKAILAFLKARLSIPSGELLKYVYTSQDMKAARHLFRIASGLESMIVGEYEVLAQVRQALETAEKTGMVNLPIRQAFYSAVRTGRRVREETGISKNALSVSSVAVDLAAGVIGDLRKCRMLIIGAGEAGRLVARVARERGASQIVIANRTKGRAQALATTLQGVPTDLSNLSEELCSADIVITCAGAPHWILNFHKVEEAMRNRSELPLVVIDIAIPRNVEPEVGRIGNVFLYNIDDLTEIANSNRKQRENEIHRAEEIVADEVNKLASWWRDLKIRPIVGALMSRAEEIRSAQLSKTLKKLPPLSDEQRESLEAMTKSIVARVLKDPIQYLKTNENGHRAEMVKELFNLNAERPK
jgi:glutamyl-tRNA reductase